MNRKGKTLNSIPIGIKNVLRFQKLRVRMLSFGSDTAHNRFATRFLSCRWYVFWNRPINPQFR